MDQDKSIYFGAPYLLFWFIVQAFCFFAYIICIVYFQYLNRLFTFDISSGCVCEQDFSYIMASYIERNDDGVRFVMDYWISIMLDHCNNSLRVDMSL